MEFRPLRMFVEVVRQGGFSQAAREVNATQSTISKAVKQLEDEIGVPLLDRIGHRSVLTTAGEIVYRRGVRLLADRDDLLAELDDLRGLGRGVLRLGLPPIGSSTLFAPLFATYRQRYPGVEVQLTEHGSDRLEESLRAGEIDFAGALLPTSEDFEVQLVRREPLVALLPPGHPLARRRRIALAELRETPFIMFESGFALHRVILDACRRAELEPKVVAVSSQIDFMVKLVAAGMGTTFLPRMIALQRAGKAVRCVPLSEPGTDWVMAMVWRRGAYLSAAAQAWLDLVRGYDWGEPAELP
ncbi:LysR family transcriptional regulator [Rhodobacter sp. 140A]|uniref:LysR family transcriptional regulator n=3 Tax=root TaxID=1 RepID=A0A443LZ58_9RHOB|nr:MULTISPECIES: LysR family transcriptional regulator [Sinirhodobacter]RBP88648.1 LysR family transcriptional regulator [Rhodobacter sp. 140A]RWR50220.1 LysR family transcriptional regulator [Sinirhodobacter ferrireducens]RWR54517.1 LysR family transcriptional regulator [Sinirhodobacter huangdaonensis]